MGLRLPVDGGGHEVRASRSDAELAPGDPDDVEAMLLEELETAVLGPIAEIHS